MATQSPFLKKPLYVSLAAALLTPVVHAQQTSNANQDIEEMIVTATRSEKPLSQIPNTVTLIGQQDLIQQIGVNNDLSTILGNLIPSFSPSRQKMTSAGESLRGRDPLYMVDGVPQSNPLRDGSRDGHTIDPLMLERIEVIHGANAIHGMGASGGIINMITRRPSDDWQQSVRLDGVGQSEDVSESLGYGASYTLSGRSGNVDFLGSANYRSSGISYDANGEVIGFDNAQGDTMDSETLNLFVKAGYEWNDQRIELTINDFDVSGNSDWVAVDGDVANGIPTTAREEKFPGKPVSNEITMFSASYSNAEILGHSLRVQAFDQEFAGTYGGGTFATYADPALGGTVFDQSQNNSNKRGVKLTLAKDNIAGSELSIIYGADFLNDETYQMLVLSGRDWVPKTNYENLALFAQFEYTGVDKLTLTAGARREDSSLDVDDFTTLYSYNGGQFVRGGSPEFSDTLANIGATYQITDQWRLFANFSEGFSMPDVGRVLRGINVPNQDVESFLNLEPIVTDNAEFGFEFDNDVVSAQLSYYASESDFGQRLQANADGIFAVKREKTEIEGFEFRSQWNVSMSDVLGLRYANTDGEYDSDGDNRVDTDLGGSNMSPNRVNISWERNWSGALNTRLQINIVQDREFENSAGVQTAEFDGYTTVDLFAEYLADFGQWRLGLQNLTNEDYFTYYSQTQGSNARNFKGIGRSVSLSWNMQF